MKNKNRTGETNIANNGQTMTIIEYKKYDDIDIQFEDGTIVKYKSYDKFKRGNIKNPNTKIGESNKTNNGQVMTIIRYRRSDDIDVQFEDGTIVKHKTYNSFKKGQIKNPNDINKYINETNIATNGQIMTIIEYRNNNDIDVQFEDDTIVRNKTYSCFKLGRIKNPNCIVAGISYNELFCLKQLEQFGFKKYNKGQLKYFGLNKLELDLYNSELKVGIEYDGGAYNKNKKYHTTEKDLKKDLLCKQAGITLYRIREPQLPKYNSSSVKFYLTNTAHGSQNLIDTLKLIIEDINKRFNMEFKYKYKHKNINIFNNKIKKSNKATNGQVMTIIKYRRCDDIDIQFEDGTIVKNKTYNSFKLGNIKNPNFNNELILKNNRLNEIVQAKNGQLMTIIEYRNSKDIDIQFEDGVIVKHKNYDCFKIGNIKNPNLQHTLKVNEINIAKNGQIITIIEYRNSKDIDIQFEDGTIVKNKSYNDFKKGMIKNPNLPNTQIKNRVGESNITTNGQTMTIIEYKNWNDIDVRFEDGTIVKNRGYSAFKSGKIRNPNYV